jgi:hypothetical protein
VLKPPGAAELIALAGKRYLPELVPALCYFLGLVLGFDCCFESGADFGVM